MTSEKPDRQTSVSPKRIYSKPTLARRERLADVTQGGVLVLPTGAVQVD